MTILYFIIGLGLLIFIHELGHFLIAKANHIRVERFSLGFGPRIFKFQWGETEYCISALPLGGYVKMTGQEDFEEDDIKPVDDPRAFSSKSLWARLSVVLAGPGMNLILPFIIMPIVFMLGRSEPIFLHNPPEVLGVIADSPAQAAGMEKGDLIISVDGKKVASWNDVLRQASKPAGTTLDVAWQREGEIQSKNITLKKHQKGGAGLWGVEPGFFIDMDPIVGEFMPSSPAETAGLEVGDKVVAINGTPIPDWRIMSEVVNKSDGKPMKFTVERGEKKIDFSIAPKFNETYQKYVIGVSKAPNPDLMQKYRYGIGESIVKGFHENIILFGMTFDVS